jgi:hypothetical protein
MNNLVGVFLDAHALVSLEATLMGFASHHKHVQIQVPSLIDAIRDAGLVVCVYGAS